MTWKYVEARLRNKFPRHWNGFSSEYMFAYVVSVTLLILLSIVTFSGGVFSLVSLIRPISFTPNIVKTECVITSLNGIDHDIQSYRVHVKDIWTCHIDIQSNISENGEQYTAEALNSPYKTFEDPNSTTTCSPGANVPCCYNRKDPGETLTAEEKYEEYDRLTAGFVLFIAFTFFMGSLFAIKGISFEHNKCIKSKDMLNKVCVDEGDML